MLSQIILYRILFRILLRILYCKFRIFCNFAFLTIQNTNRMEDVKNDEILEAFSFSPDFHRDKEIIWINSPSHRLSKMNTSNI